MVSLAIIVSVTQRPLLIFNRFETFALKYSFVIGSCYRGKHILNTVVRGI